MFYVLLCYDQTLGVCRHSHVIGPLTPPHAPSAHRQLPSCRSQAVDVLCKSHALHTRAPESSDALLWPAISIGNPRLPRGCLPGPVPGRSSLWPAGPRESGLHGEYGTCQLLIPGLEWNELRGKGTVAQALHLSTPVFSALAAGHLTFFLQ